MFLQWTFMFLIFTLISYSQRGKIQNLFAWSINFNSLIKTIYFDSLTHETTRKVPITLMAKISNLPWSKPCILIVECQLEGALGFYTKIYFLFQEVSFVVILQKNI